MHNQLYNNDTCKVKNLRGGGMHWCLPLLRSNVNFLACLCLGAMLTFLRFKNIDPQSSELTLLARHHNQLLE
jgi:hypothetical protein